jgi:hypothetical protein
MDSVTNANLKLNTLAVKFTVLGFTLTFRDEGQIKLCKLNVGE